MKKIPVLIIGFLLLCSHSMFLKLDSFFVRPFATADIHLLNGTFLTSENVISRDRMKDVSIIGPGYNFSYNEKMWSERENTTVLEFKAGEAGTYVAGVSTLPRNIELTAIEFNEYLEHDGIIDVLEKRKEKGQLENAAVERYEKHVKAILQVGNKRSDNYDDPLDYPIEFIPVDNPYKIREGELFKVQLLFNGQPLAGQLVYADHEKTGDAHNHDSEDTARTDSEGMVQFNLDHEGKWYIRTIYMRESELEGLNYESYWATLTFEIR